MGSSGDLLLTSCDQRMQICVSNIISSSHLCMHAKKSGLWVLSIMHNHGICITSNGDLRRKQSNHKTDESMKFCQSAGFFGQFFLFFFIGDTPLSKKKTSLYR